MSIRLDEATEEFLIALDAANRAPKTLRWYRMILERFAARGGELTPGSVRRYFAARRKEISPASLAGEDRALRRFCAWLVAQGLIPDNPMRLVDRLKEGETVPQVAGADVVQQLLAVVDRGSRWPLRDRAVVLVLADTGARLSEFLAITADNLRVALREDGTAHGEALVIGKGSRRRRLLIGPEAMTALAAWMAERPPEAGPVIWWGERGPLGEWGVRLVLRRLSARAGLPKAIHPHAFRHGLAVDALAAGADLNALQAMLGHTQLQTTARYLHIADRRIEQVHDQVSAARFGPGK